MLPLNTHRRGRPSPRHLLAAATIATLAMGVSACSSSSTATQADTKTPATITYAYWDATDTPAFQSAAKQFHKENPNINIDLRVVPFANYFTKLNTQIQSKSAPDAFWLQTSQFPLYADNGALADLTSYTTASQADIKGLDQSLTKAFTVGGKLYAMPFQALTFALYYNKALFQKAGVALPTSSWTWDDATAAAAKLTNASSKQYGLTAPLWNLGTYYQTMYQYGAKIITDGGKSTDFDSPAAIQGLSVWTNLVKKGYSPNVAQLTDTNQDQWFESGKAAMVTCGPWTINAYHKALGDNLGIISLPKGTVDTTGAAVTASAVSANSSHISQAYKWTEFLSSTEGQTIINSDPTSGTGAPANSSADGAWLKTVGVPSAQVFLDEIAKSTPFPATKNTAAWEAAEPATFAAAWDGKASLPAAAATMSTVIKKALATE